MQEGRWKARGEGSHGARRLVGSQGSAVSGVKRLGYVLRRDSFQKKASWRIRALNQRLQA